LLAIFVKKILQLRTLLEQLKFYRIPLQKLATGHYKFQVKVNNKKGRFILDTGASTSCIGLDQATYFLLHGEVSDVKAAGAGAINMETKIARNNQLKMGDKVLKNIDLILFNLSHVNEALAQVDEDAIDGIIGADLLKQCQAKIDYGRNCLYIK
jgi:predicted aspartyl protease